MRAGNTASRRDGLGRGEILAISRGILEREGKAALTIRRIAEAVGRTQPAVYARFTDKDELIAALALDGFETLAGLLERAAARKDPLAAVATAYVAFANDRPQLYDVMFIEPISIRFASGSSTPPALHRSFDALLTAASRERDDKPQLDRGRLELVAETLWASLHGIIALSGHHRIRPGSNLQRQRIQAIVRGARAMLG